MDIYWSCKIVFVVSANSFFQKFFVLLWKKKLRSRQKKLKPYDLSSLTEFLPELKNCQQPTPAEFKLNCKSRKKLILKEAKQMSTVLNHPAFQLDPLAALAQHLESTQPVIEEKPKKKKKNKNGGRKKKDKKSKSSTGPESVDMLLDK
ncbi:uncharacterized protein LOC133798018 isoform X2 [Humulus lupulus]|uniref:uncharacterized protein LOC133798018 isoform X2 n=1 Tax=Humulus lupulus TaxID=3486 RepID=UPI002B4088C0|nr:uncharacterized protein LOC133798018 isoform X2 [Humulus lupulus]